MNYQMKLIIEFKKTKEEVLFNEIIFSFKPLILSFIKKIPNFYKEDMYEELIIELYKLLNTFVIKKYEIDDIHFKHFKEKYEQTMTEQKLTLKEKENNLALEYSLFCNEKQFVSYLNKAFNGVIVDFYRRHKEEFKVKTISLNSLISENLELIDVIADTTNKSISPFDEYGLTNKELEFLNSFIENRKIISEA